jgi:hypothetical protein
MRAIPLTAPTLPTSEVPLGQIVMTTNAAGRFDTIAVPEGLRRHARGYRISWFDSRRHSVLLSDLEGMS